MPGYPRQIEAWPFDIVKKRTGADAERILHEMAEAVEAPDNASAVRERDDALRVWIRDQPRDAARQIVEERLAEIDPGWSGHLRIDEPDD